MITASVSAAALTPGSRCIDTFTSVPRGDSESISPTRTPRMRTSEPEYTPTVSGNIALKVTPGRCFHHHSTPAVIATTSTTTTTTTRAHAGRCRVGAVI